MGLTSSSGGPVPLTLDARILNRYSWPSVTLDSKVGALAQAGNDNPFILSDVSSLYKIVGNLGASIKLLGTPV